MISPRVVPSLPSADALPQRAADEAVDAVVPLAKLLADETRVRILVLLGGQTELCVRDLWENLAQTQPGVSHHLALLREAGLVQARQAGRNIYYRLNRQRLAELLSAFRETPLGQVLRPAAR